MAAAQKWFAEQLNGVEGGAARAYLAERGIDAKAIERFGIGFAPDAARQAQGRAQGPRRGQARRDRHADPAREGDKASYDRFRGRLMIPIRDARGRVIAFGGRILGRRRAQISQLARHAPLRQGPHPLQHRPRQPRQPRGQAADRRRRLYGRHRPRPRRHRRGRGAERHGGDRGAARADVAARRRSRSAASTATPPGRRRRSARPLRALPHLAPERTLRFVALPAGQDPDDLVRSGGREAVEALLASARAAGRAPVASRSRGRAARHARGPRRPQAAPDGACPGDRRPQSSASSTATNGCANSTRWSARSRPAAPLALPAPRMEEARTADSPRRPPPASAAARAIGSAGIDKTTARALVLGHALYPDAIGDHVEALAALPIADQRRIKAARSDGRSHHVGPNA